MRGEYELCVAYLKFLTSSVASKKPNSALLASLLYTLVEIFAQHTRWHYKSAAFKHDIGYYCYEIAQAVLSLNVSSNTDAKKLVDVIRAALLSGNTGELLLKTIQTGRDRVKGVIHSSGSAILLHKDRQVISVRTKLTFASTIAHINIFKQF